MWRHNYNPYPRLSGKNLSIMQRVGTPVRFYPVFLHSRSDRTRPVVRSNGAKTLLDFGFVNIAVWVALDGFLFIFLGFYYAPSIWFLTGPANLEAPSTYINLTCCVGMEPRRTPSFPRFVRSCLCRFRRLTVLFCTMIVVCSSIPRSRLPSPRQSDNNNL